MSRNRTNTSSIYRPRRDPGHAADGDLGLCAPHYRGFILHCLGAEVPAKRCAVDDYWARRYNAAGTPAERMAVMRQEHEQRNLPRDWNGI